MSSTNYTFILSFWLPKFFYDEYRHTKIQAWHYNVIPWIGVIPGAVISGCLSDLLVKKTNLSLTAVRKYIEVIALIGSALFLQPLTKIDSGSAGLINSMNLNLQNSAIYPSHFLEMTSKMVYGNMTDQEVESSSSQLNAKSQRSVRSESSSSDVSLLDENIIRRYKRADSLNSKSNPEKSNPYNEIPVETALFYICISIGLSNFHAASAIRGKMI